MVVKIEPCIMCNRSFVEVEFRDTISHQAFVECLYEPCRYVGPVVTGKTPQEAIDGAVKAWNDLQEVRE